MNMDGPSKPKPRIQQAHNAVQSVADYLKTPFKPTLPSNDIPQIIEEKKISDQVTQSTDLPDSSSTSIDESKIIHQTYLDSLSEPPSIVQDDMETKNGKKMNSKSQRNQEEEKKRLREKMQALQAKLATAQQNENDFQKKVISQQETIKHLKSMINELKNELVDQQTKSNIVTSQKQREIEDLKNSLKNIKNQQKGSRKELEEQVLKTQEELHKQEAASRLIEQQLRSKIESLTKEINLLKKQQDDKVLQASKSYMEENESLQQQVHHLQSQIASLKASISQLQKRKNLLKVLKSMELYVKDETISEERQLRRTHEDQLIQLEILRKEMEEAIVKLQDTENTMKEENEALRQELESWKTENSILQQRNNQAAQEYQEKEQTILMEAYSKEQQLLKEIEELKQKEDSRVIQQRLWENDMNATNDKLLQEIATVNTEKRTLKDSVEQLTQELVQRNLKIEALTEAMEQLQLKHAMVNRSTQTEDDTVSFYTPTPHPDETAQILTEGDLLELTPRRVDNLFRAIKSLKQNPQSKMVETTREDLQQKQDQLKTRNSEIVLAGGVLGGLTLVGICAGFLSWLSHRK